jgi:hypothetical protein
MALRRYTLETCKEIPQKRDISQASCSVHPQPERKKMNRGTVWPGFEKLKKSLTREKCKQGGYRIGLDTRN